MIAQIKGQVASVSSESIVLDVQGVGYELLCSLSTLAELQVQAMNSLGAYAKSGDILLYVYTHVREDALQLFGFLSLEEKKMFTALLKVNGIGPKSALNILSGATLNQIHTMIEQEDVKGLSKLPKVGKKSAEQMILTLKGKLVLNSSESVPSKLGDPVLQDVSSALVNLGFKPQDVEKVVASLDPSVGLQEGIRQGLTALSSL